MIRLKDVAERAQVSEATASLVMNNRPGVNSETRKRVIEASIDLGYTPNFIARGLAMQKTNTIGLVVTDIENPFFGSLTRYIDEYVLEKDCNLILSVSNDDAELEERIVNDFIGKRVDGVIIVPTVKATKRMPYFKQLESHKIPYVFATSFYPDVECECIMADLEEGSYKLTNYLIQLGHREIIFLATVSKEGIPSKLRIEGYKRALEENGIAFDSNRIVECKRADFSCGYSSTKRVLRANNIDAITTVNDIMALGAKRAVKELGYHVPEDISVAGYDDVIFSSISEVPLTTIKQNVQQISRETVNILFDKINDKVIHEKLVKVKTDLIVRGSTGPSKRV